MNLFWLLVELKEKRPHVRPPPPPSSPLSAVEHCPAHHVLVRRVLAELDRVELDAKASAPVSGFLNS